MDRLINKLMNFIDDFFESEDIFISKKAKKLKRAIHYCASIMIFEAISKNTDKFSKRYIREIEDYSIVRFSYFERLKRNSK